jgi:hypothetical protein
VPEVTITVDGQRLNIPATPIYSTNANGYTEANHYQVYAPLKANSVIKAKSNQVKEDGSDVLKFDISAIADGRASVRATYQGKTKTYLIN